MICMPAFLNFRVLLVSYREGGSHTLKYHVHNFQMPPSFDVYENAQSYAKINHIWKFLGSQYRHCEWDEKLSSSFNFVIIKSVYMHSPFSVLVQRWWARQEIWKTREARLIWSFVTYSLHYLEVTFRFLSFPFLLRLDWWFEWSSRGKGRRQQEKRSVTVFPIVCGPWPFDLPPIRRLSQIRRLSPIRRLSICTCCWHKDCHIDVHGFSILIMSLIFV